MKSKIYVLMMLPIMGMAVEGYFDIGSTVWQDTNQNWKQDNEEKGIAGVKVKLEWASGQSIKTTTTNKYGKYRFNVEVGDYVVKVVVPKGMKMVTDAEYEMWLDKDRKDINFGLYGEEHIGDFTIVGNIWHDTNQNWIQDNREKDIEKVRVNLYKASGEKVSTTKTRSNGKYYFHELPEGDYVVKVEVPEGMIAITDTKLEVWLDKSRKDMDFGLYNKKHTGDFSIGNRVWIDTNENWKQDYGEKGIGGVTVNLFKASGEKVSTRKTTSNGNYNFKALPEGDYVVKVELPDGIKAVTNTSLEVWLDKSRVDMDFGVYKKGVVVPPPVDVEPITYDKLEKMIQNGEDVTKVNTSELTHLSGLFYKNKTFNQDISGWDVSNVIYMDEMFYGATEFNQNLNYWDVSNVRHMREMFRGASKFNQELNNWDVSKVNYFRHIFKGADAMEEINKPAKFRKYQAGEPILRSQLDHMISIGEDVRKVNISKITDMSNLFYKHTDFNQDISGWDVSHVTNMEEMFYGAHRFNQDISSWDVSNVTEFKGIFIDADALEEKNKPEKFK